MTVQDFIGISYVSKGRARDGCDCYGLVYLYYRDVLGIKLPEYATEYTDAEELDEVARLVARGRPNWVEVSPPREGDVVLLKIWREPVHVGVYVGDGRMLHVRRGANACLERLDGPFWRSRIDGYFRHVG